MSDAWLPRTVRPYYTSARFETMGVYEEAGIPRGSDDSPVDVLACGVGDATVFGFREAAALYAMRLVGGTTDVRVTRLDHPPLGLYRAYASVLVHVASGEILQYVLKDGMLQRDGDVLMTVKDVRAPKASFEVVTDSEPALFLFEATLESGRVAQAFQQGERIVLHPVDTEHQHFSRDYKTDRLACFRFTDAGRDLADGHGNVVRLPQDSTVLDVTQDYVLALDGAAAVALHFRQALRAADFTCPLPDVEAVYGHELLPQHQLAPALLTPSHVPVDTQRTQVLHLLVNNGEGICTFDLARVWRDDHCAYMVAMLNSDAPAYSASAYVPPMLGDGQM